MSADDDIKWEAGKRQFTLCESDALVRRCPRNGSHRLVKARYQPNENRPVGQQHTQDAEGIVGDKYNACRVVLLCTCQTLPNVVTFVGDTVKKIVFVSALSIVGAHADEPVEFVTVIGTRSTPSVNAVPAFIQVISEEEIRRSGALTLADVLSTQTGLSISDSIGNGGRGVAVSMRGFSENAGNNVLILIDGRKLNNPSLAGPDLSSVPVQSIARIEILQGSAGSLYGDQATAGVINIITKQAKDTSATLSFQAGSYQHRDVALHFSNQMTDAVSMVLSVENLSKDNYRDHNQNYHRDVSLQTRYQHSDLNVTVYLQNVADDLQLPGAVDGQQYRDQPRSSTSTDIANNETIVKRLSGQWEVSSVWSVWLDMTQRDLDSKGQFYGSPFTGHTGVQSIQPRVVAEFDTGAGRSHLVAGIDWERDDYEADYGFSVTDIAQAVDDVYVQGLVGMIPAVQLSLAARRSDFSFSPYSTSQEYDDSLTVYSVAANYQFNDVSSLYFRGDTGFRWPNADENGFIDPLSEHLEPQQSRSTEVGFLATQNTISWKAALYTTDIKNEIIYDPTANGPYGQGTGANVNRDDAVRTGALFDVRWALNDVLQWKAGIAYVDAKFDAGIHDGKQLPFNAKRTANTQLQLRLNDDWSTYIEATYTGGRYRAGDEANQHGLLGGYMVWNANIAWQFESFALQLRVNNVLNKHYSAYSGVSPFSGPFYYPAAERNAVLIISYQF